MVSLREIIPEAEIVGTSSSGDSRGIFAPSVITANKVIFRGTSDIFLTPDVTSAFECSYGTDREGSACENESQDYCLKKNDSISTDETDEEQEIMLITNTNSLTDKRLIPEKGCEYFCNVENYAYYLVDDILHEATTRLKDTYGFAVIDKIRRVSTLKNIIWPSIKDFDEKCIIENLKEYIDFTSAVNEDWTYTIELNAKSSNSVSDFYEYDAKFSIPTKCYPVPQATASVYFMIEVSRVKPSHCPVDVTFQFEGNESVLVPGRTVITEELLFRILRNKLTLFKSLKY